MKLDDARALRAIRRHAADEAAQQAAHADAQHADASDAVVAFRTDMGDEAMRAQGLGLSRALALWYRAAASRLQDLEASEVRRADEAVTARESLRSAAVEAERMDTVSEQLETRRRQELARRAQGELDEAALRRSRRFPYREI
jgi:hypothetical protein